MVEVRRFTDDDLVRCPSCNPIFGGTMFRTYKNSMRRQRDCRMCTGSGHVKLGVAKTFRMLENETMAELDGERDAKARRGGATAVKGRGR